MRWNIGQIALPPELERHFEQYERLGGDLRAMAITLLGDETYVRQVKMPKWSSTVDMLREHKVAVRHGSSWGIPTSKDAHRQRAEYFAGVAETLQAAWDDLVERAVALFGDHGSLISGCYRDHFPPPVKNRLRFLAHGRTMAKDAERLHLYLSKTRSPLFR